jgi:hypothetical protein
MGAMLSELIQNHIMASAIIIAGVVSGAVRWLVYLSVKGYVKASQI